MSAPTKRLIPLFLILSQVLQAAESPSSGRSAEDAFQFFQEEAQVVTASRRLQPVKDSPVTVEVITAEDIKAAGVVNLWDLMRFRAGMNVIEGRSIEGNRAVVSVRGFPSEYVGSLQVLVDGRSVYQPVTNGVYWEQLPVQMQDIERIEIVRGPNAALYGSNAGQGVINIITKKPQGKTGSLGATGGNLNTLIGAEAIDSAVKDVQFRLSHTYREDSGFPSASAGPIVHDRLRDDNKVNFRGSWAPSGQTLVDVFSGGAWTASETPVLPAENAYFAQDFQMVKAAHTQAGNGVIEGTFSRSHYVADQWPTPPQKSGVSVLQYDGELLYRLGWLEDRLYSASGISFRRASAESSTFFAGTDKITDDTVRGFLNQSVKLTEKLSVVGAVSLEHASLGDETEPAYQAAALYNFTKAHGIRASYSLAPMMPSMIYRDANLDFQPGVHLSGNPILAPQKLTSYELGYRGQIQNVRIETSLFYMVIRDLYNTTYDFSAFPFILSFANRDKAFARGAETSVTYSFKTGQSVYANYTYEHINSALRTATVNKGTPAHMFNVGGMTPLARGFSLSTNVGFKDAYTITSAGHNVTVDAPAHVRVDARLGYTPPRYPNWILFMACQNMTQSEHVEFADGLTVPRTYQGGVSVKFGGHP